MTAFALLLRVWTIPLGISVFATDALAGSTSLFGGAFAAAWAPLPVSPWSLRRAVSLHGLASLLVVGASFAGPSDTPGCF